MLFTDRRALWLLLLVVVLGSVLYSNYSSHFREGEAFFGYGDGYYISQTSNNLINGEGYSYWNGHRYVFWDYEISTGPTIIYPQALGQLLGLDKYNTFFFVPLILHLVLYAALLMVWRSRLKIDIFYAATGLLTLFFLSFYQWFWYLPLGEIQALLWFLLALTFSLASKRPRDFLVAGLCAGLALLSKMMMILSLPLLFAYLFLRVSTLSAIRFAVGVALICGLFLISIYMTSPSSIGVIEFFEYFLEFIMYSFGWAFPEFYVLDKFIEVGLSKKIWFALGSLNEPFSGKDNLGYFFFGGLSVMAALLAALIVFCRRRLVDWHVFLLVAALLGAYFSWGFLIGVKTFRYSFIFFSLLLLCVVLLSSMAGKVYFYTVSIALALSLVFVISVRGIVYPAYEDDVKNTQLAASSLEDFLSRKGIGQVYITESLYLPYLNLAYFVSRADSLQSVYRYVDALPVLSDVTECEDLKNKFESMYLYNKNPHSSTSWCRLNKISLRLDFSQAPPFFWMLDYGERGNDYPICRNLQWQSGNYYLYHCDREEVAAFIERNNRGLIQLEGK